MSSVIFFQASVNTWPFTGSKEMHSLYHVFSCLPHAKELILIKILVLIRWISHLEPSLWNQWDFIVSVSLVPESQWGFFFLLNLSS